MKFLPGAGHRQMATDSIRVRFPLPHHLLFIILSLFSLLNHSSPTSALRILVEPQTTIGAPTTVFWVREPTDPLPLFDLRFVVHGEGRDDGLAGANIDFTDNNGGTSDGVRNIGRQVVQFPRAGRYVLVAVSGPDNQQIGTSNRIIVSPPPTITLTTSSSSSVGPTSTSSPTSSTTFSPVPARTNKAAVIVGAVVGTILFLSLVALVVFVLLKRRRIRQEQNRLSFHPEEMIQRRRSRWISVSRFSVSRGGGARAVEADRAEAGGNPQHTEGSDVDVEAQTAGRRPSDGSDVVFDADQHRKSAVSSVRTSLNSFSTESRSRYSGDAEALQGAGRGLAVIAELLSVPPNGHLTIPAPPSSAPPPLVRALPAIPTGPVFDDDAMSAITQSRKGSAATTDTSLSGLTLDIPARPLPPVSIPTPILETPTAAPSVPTTARTPRPLPTPAAHRPAPTPAALVQPYSATATRALPPLPVTPASALPFPPTPQTAAAVTFPTPTHCDHQALLSPRTPRQKLIDRRLAQVQSQLSLLRKKLSRGQVDREVGVRVERDLLKQVGWLEATREGPWARDMSGGDDEMPQGWARYMTP